MKTILLALVFSLLMVAQQTRQERIVICTDAGASDSYSCTPTPTVTTLTTGLRVRLYPNTANTGAATVDVDGGGALTAKTIVKVAGGITTALADNDIRVGQYVELLYDGTNFQMQSMLGNAAAGGSGIKWSDHISLSGGVANGATIYIGLPGQANTTSDTVQSPIPATGTLKNLYSVLRTAQSAGGGLQCWLNVNTVPTAITVTHAASAAANTAETDLVNTVAVTAGDRISVKCTNSGSTTSGIPTFFWVVE